MADEIEVMEARGRSYLKGYLIAFYIFMFLWIVRFFFRESGLNYEPIGYLVLAGLIIMVLIQAFFMGRLALWKKKVRGDSRLNAALNNELIKLYELRSWKIAFLSAVGSTFFFAVVSFFYPICDLVLVALTSLIVGGGAHMTAFYVMNRS
jgi:hypothetical protein